jgi:ribosome-binding factor A
MTSEQIKRKRVESVLREILPEALSGLSDSRINSLLVTEVVCSRGRSNAKVYLDKAFMDEKEQNEALKQLRKVGAYLQNYCKQSEGWFKAPIFTFEFDDQLAHQTKMDNLFKKISQKNPIDKMEQE